MGFVLGAEIPSQHGFLVKDHEQSDTDHDCEGDRNDQEVCLSEDNPEADPSMMKPRYIGLPTLAIKPVTTSFFRENSEAIVAGPMAATFRRVRIGRGHDVYTAP